MQVKTIAFYHYTFPAGGAEVVTCNLGRFFAKHGFRILLYTWKPNAELLTEELRKIFDIRPLPDTKRISGVRNTDFLCESLKTERADVLFIQATTDIAFEQIRTRTTAKIISVSDSLILSPSFRLSFSRSGRKLPSRMYTGILSIGTSTLLCTGPEISSFKFHRLIHRPSGK